ncbi:hypothetical protein HDU87_003030 [Geranomyces variabilis]|uniref:Uncharacterized protein n=1 Tax=Geranomyces variabilis TaxID=109894 RepID=A0AAD5TN25_9FUNG|nr:hypothetical protein HDU87_003030 [Geranomyces variabilis]
MSLPPGVLGPLDAAITELIHAYPPRRPRPDSHYLLTPDMPGPYGTLRLGFGAPQNYNGPPEEMRPVVSDECCLRHGRVAAPIAKFIGSGAMRAVSLLVNRLFEELDGRESARYRAAFSRHRNEKAVWAGNPEQDTFSVVELVANVYATNHRDYDSYDGWCAVIPVGNFTGGELCMPDLKAKVPLAAGDVFFFRSGAIDYVLNKWTGDHRYLLLFRMDHVVLESPGS